MSVKNISVNKIDAPKLEIETNITNKIAEKNIGFQKSDFRLGS